MTNEQTTESEVLGFSHATIDKAVEIYIAAGHRMPAVIDGVIHQTHENYARNKVEIAVGWTEAYVSDSSGELEWTELDHESDGPVAYQPSAMELATIAHEISHEGRLSPSTLDRFGMNWRIEVSSP